MKFILVLGILLDMISLSDVPVQAKSKNEKVQYAFIMVINNESTKFYFSPVFKFEVDKREIQFVISRKKKQNTVAKLPMKNLTW